MKIWSKTIFLISRSIPMIYCNFLHFYKDQVPLGIHEGRANLTYEERTEFYSNSLYLKNSYEGHIT